MNSGERTDAVNFLGHWRFSEPSPEALIGSLWPDFGKRPDPAAVSEVFLVHFDRHQWLDRVTDSSPLLEPLRTVLRPKLRKTTPVVVDMLIDHHLAKHWQRYHSEPIGRFTEKCYREARRFDALALPERLGKTLYWMSKDDWLSGYRHPENVLRALGGLSRRIRFADPMERYGYWSIEQLEEHEPAVEAFLLSITGRLAAQKKS